MLWVVEVFCGVLDIFGPLLSMNLPEQCTFCLTLQDGEPFQEKEALALLLWRAYDCSVNCVQDACCWD